MHQPYFFSLFIYFFKADAFKDTCPSFTMAGVSLFGALKPHDRAGTWLSGELAEAALVTADGDWEPAAQGGDGGLLRGPFPEPAEQRRWPGLQPACLAPEMSFTLIGCDRSELSPGTW